MHQARCTHLEHVLILLVRLRLSGCAASLSDPLRHRARNAGQRSTRGSMVSLRTFWRADLPSGWFPAPSTGSLPLSGLSPLSGSRSRSLGCSLAPCDSVLPLCNQGVVAANLAFACFGSC
ncbi:uncharacterized protein SCHCODRAFT_02640013 [Schizophyllum commune H4-8]|uniref:uncharacterized protein n=1 Tax=Schizophyllum commune (strain H4-8 / FGSC 9210) TaxID=578458 RepID=UPI0021600432|nr:uncharacterized protein SCHCODRAFT_02639972 [Schizophyllum commune H4-8]XP_050197841.1 uncharacterized protein SCHCODRAFT_02640013 [Schizophyllum commune H4-8]KAI5886841.1 hypothetical protein SCHCODRAFT_02639972 [Schizophyllum commune H4-8]KAI5886849.1 hypothetical protein SCHCODRAFT_02640013 [Schizophyllum commune H4-8]